MSTATTTDAIWFIDNLARVLVGGETSQGRLAVVEIEGRRGDMPPLHVHRREDEVFYVLDGELSVHTRTARSSFAPERRSSRPGTSRTSTASSRPRTLAGDRDTGRVRRLRPGGAASPRRRRSPARGTRARPRPSGGDRRAARDRAARPSRDDALTRQEPWAAAASSSRIAAFGFSVSGAPWSRQRIPKSSPSRPSTLRRVSAGSSWYSNGTNASPFP